MIAGGTGIAAVAGMSGQHLYVRKQWKDTHPLVTGSMDLLLKDGKVLKTLGYPLEFRENISGIFDTDKTWCNFNYTIAGPNGLAKVSLLADNKIIEDSPKDADQFIIEGTAPYASLYSQILDKVMGNTPDPRLHHWRIISMYIRIGDGNDAYTMIGDDVKSHNELFAAPYIESIDDFEELDLVSEK
jgi:hypothetical protein